MPDFYEHLKCQFEAIKDAELCLQKCRDNCTSLMEQCFHMFTRVEDIPPVVAKEGPAIPQPASTVLGLADYPACTFPTEEVAQGFDITQPMPDEADIPCSNVVVYPDSPQQTGVVSVRYE